MPIFFSKEVEKEYRRCLQIIDKYRRKGLVNSYNYDYSTISVEEVLRAHFLLVDFFMEPENYISPDNIKRYRNLLGKGLGGVGPRDINILMSTVSRQIVVFGNKVKWSSNYEVIAALYFGLIENHPFFDGNKRTATLVLLYHLYKIGRIPKVKQMEFEELALKVASKNLESYPKYKKYSRILKKHSNKGYTKNDVEILFLADKIKRMTRSLDKRIFLVTYNDLRAILNKYSYDIDDPHGGYINVYRVYYTKGIFTGFKKRIQKKRILTIPFPGWGKKVGKSVLTKVLKVTGLNPSNGYDAEVIFRDADPIPVLIGEYYGLFARLANK